MSGSFQEQFLFVVSCDPTNTSPDYTALLSRCRIFIGNFKIDIRVRNVTARFSQVDCINCITGKAVSFRFIADRICGFAKTHSAAGLVQYTRG